MSQDDKPVKAPKTAKKVSKPTKNQIEKDQAKESRPRKRAAGESQDASRHEGDIKKHGSATKRRQEHKQHEMSHVQTKRARIPNDFKRAPV